VARKGGLGRGLTALIPASDGDAGEAGRRGLQGARRWQPCEPNPHQPRQVRFDEETLEGLTDSVRERSGCCSRSSFVPNEDGRYELIAGERRWRAAKPAGLPTIPAIVRTVDDLRRRSNTRWWRTSTAKT
jgi:ParB family transcriptional regulator, chromosome partitioning protein